MVRQRLVGTSFHGCGCIRIDPLTNPVGGRANEAQLAATLAVEPCDAPLRARGGEPAGDGDGKRGGWSSDLDLDLENCLTPRLFCPPRCTRSRLGRLWTHLGRQPVL